MKYSLEYITERLNRLVKPYLAQDPKGNILEKEGYLHRTRMWPRHDKDSASWALLFYLPPTYESAGELLFEYYFTLQQTFSRPGFYVNFTYVGCNLECALENMKQRLDSIPKRDHG